MLAGVGPAQLLGRSIIMERIVILMKSVTLMTVIQVCGLLEVMLELVKASGSCC